MNTEAFVLVFNRMMLVSLVESGEGAQMMQGAWQNWERRFDDERGDHQLFCLEHNTTEG